MSVVKGTIRKLNKIRKIVLLLFLWPKGMGNFLLSTLSYVLRMRRVLGKPICITIEVATICNLGCSLCKTGTHELQREKRIMDFESFKKIADQIAPFANTVMLYFMGETFLNKDVYRMIRYLKEKKIFVTSCTNGDTVKPKELVHSGIDEVVFQIGGTTQEVHEIYRVNSNLETILDNIRSIIRIKAEDGRDLTTVKLGLIIMKHNEHQIGDFFKLASELGIDSAEIVNTAVQNYDQAKRYLTNDRTYWNYSPQEFDKGRLHPRTLLNNECSWIYYSSVITVDGSVVPCCRDAHAHYVMGNVFKKDFSSIWNNEKYRSFRNSILTRQRQCELCDLCWGFGVPLPEPKAQKECV